MEGWFSILNQDSGLLKYAGGVMKRILLIGMMAGLLAGLMAGCSDDEDDPVPAGTVVVTTNIVNGVPVVTTNVVAAPASSSNEDQAVPVVTTNVVNGTILVQTNWVLTLPADDGPTAPQLLAPANKALFAVDAGGKARVTFRWTALPGVDSYSHRMGHYPGTMVFRGTTGTMEYTKGIYTWWVQGNYPDGSGRVEPGPASQKFVFIVQ
jgi:hypothetical protein